MRGIFRIIFAVGLSVLIPFLLKIWFGIEWHWLSTAICIGLPVIIFIIARKSDNVTVNTKVTDERIVNMQTGEETEELFRHSDYANYTLTVEDNNDKVYNSPDGRAVMTRMVTRTTQVNKRYPLFPWVIYTPLSVLLSIMLCNEIVYQESIGAALKGVFNMFAFPWS